MNFIKVLVFIMTASLALAWASDDGLNEAYSTLQKPNLTKEEVKAIATKYPQTHTTIFKNLLSQASYKDWSDVAQYITKLDSFDDMGFWYFMEYTIKTHNDAAWNKLAFDITQRNLVGEDKLRSRWGHGVEAFYKHGIVDRFDDATKKKIAESFVNYNDYIGTWELLRAISDKPQIYDMLKIANIAIENGQTTYISSYIFSEYYVYGEKWEATVSKYLDYLASVKNNKSSVNESIVRNQVESFGKYYLSRLESLENDPVIIKKYVNLLNEYSLLTFYENVLHDDNFASYRPYVEKIKMQYIDKYLSQVGASFVSGEKFVQRSGNRLAAGSELGIIMNYFSDMKNGKLYMLEQYIKNDPQLTQASLKKRYWQNKFGITKICNWFMNKS